MPDDRKDEPFDPLPQLIADIDQALKMAPELARASKAYYDAFIEAGFTEPQALYLTVCQFKDPEPPSD